MRILSLPFFLGTTYSQDFETLITCGSLIKIKNTKHSNTKLSFIPKDEDDINADMKNLSYSDDTEKVVTGNPNSDGLHSYWLVNGDDNESEEPRVCKKGYPIWCGFKIKLFHISEEGFLATRKGASADLRVRKSLINDLEP